MRRVLSGIVVVITILSAACGGRASSPLSPSGIPPTPASSTTGATVLGTVRLGLTAPVVGSSADPMKVEVVGTAIVAVVSAAGQFELGNVPAGQVRLHFFGAGVDAYVTISQVGSGETVTIGVTVVGTSAVVDSQLRNTQSQQQEIEGRVESLPPTQSAGTLVVAGRTVKTDAATVIKQGSVTGSFADLVVGQRVHVKGRVEGDAIVASLIEIQNTQTDTPVNVNGIVQGLTGSELAFQFTIDGRLIKGDHQTQFDSGVSPTFADLKNGARVEVKGQQQDGAIYAVRIHIQNDEGGGAVELSGAIGALTGSCPQVSFTLKGSRVATGTSTTFTGAGCVALKNGVEVEVKATKQSDGTVLATKVWVEEEKKDTPYNGSGTIGSLSGSCPVTSFMLSPTTITSGSTVKIYTNSATVFSGAGCAGLKNGVKVEVKGTTQADGVVLATKVTVEEQKETPYEGSGTITSLSGSCPAVNFMLSPTATVSGSAVKIYTNSATVFSGAGCAGLKNGVKVQVTGTTRTDGLLVASKVVVEEEKTGTAYEGKGTIGGLSGSCPTVTFSLTLATVVSSSTVTVYTNTATVFSGGGCSDLMKTGLKVLVKGTKQTDGKVLATKIEKI